MAQTPTRICKSPLQKLVIPPSPFLQKLGYGTGVNVWQLQRTPKGPGTMSPWAVKNVRKGLAAEFVKEYETRITVEADILSSIEHENIVKFHGYYTSGDGRKCLAMEKCGISLGNMIEQRLESDLGPYPAKNILKTVLSLAQALEYLHSKNILHADIKSYNVLVKGDFEVIKLCDFGVSSKLLNGVATHFIGTSVYSAPECQGDAEDPITSKSDIFSLGLVIWEMLALIPPHSGNLSGGDTTDSDSSTDMDSTVNTEGGNTEVVYGTRPPLPAVSLGSEYNPVIEMFVCCTEQTAEKRPSAACIVNHLKQLKIT